MHHFNLLVPQDVLTLIPGVDERLSAAATLACVAIDCEVDEASYCEPIADERYAALLDDDLVFDGDEVVRPKVWIERTGGGWFHRR